MGEFSPFHWLLVIAIALLLFGTSKFTAVGKGIGEGIRNFKAAMKEGEKEGDADKTEKKEEEKKSKSPPAQLFLTFTTNPPRNISDHSSFAQHGIHPRHRKPHHIAVVAFNPRDPARSNPLNPISPGLIHRFAGGDVVANLTLRKFAERDQSCLGGSFCSTANWQLATDNCTYGTRSHQAHSGDHRMRPSRQQSQHASRIVSVMRLAENNVIDHHDGIRAENITLRMDSKNRQRFFSRQPLGTFLSSLTRAWALIDISGLHRERNTRVAQQLLTAGRGGGENQHAI